MVNKITGHRTFNGEFTPADKPERLTIAVSRVHGRATSEKTSWMVWVKCHVFACSNFDCVGILNLNDFFCARIYLSC